MKRRDFIGKASVASVVAGASITAAPAVHAQQKYKWKMVTTWPKNFPGLGTGAETLARLITEMTDGVVSIKVYGAGELVPAFEAFDAVSSGTAEMGHGAAYYWKGKELATQFFVAVPFGFTSNETDAWLYHGGGMDVWKKVYGEFGLVPGAAGNTGVQMAGWFNKEINSVEDLKGLKMRIPGFGAEALKRAGGTPVSLPGGELFQALQSGTIDATEFVGPYNDLAFGLFEAAKYYYYPGWHEPGTIIETFFNKKALESLPKHLQRVVQYAVRVACQEMLADFNAKNGPALQTLVNDHGVQLRKLPDDVLKSLKTLAEEAVRETAETNALTKEAYESFTKFRDVVVPWTNVSERAYLNARAL